MIDDLNHKFPSMRPGRLPQRHDKHVRNRLPGVPKLGALLSDIRLVAQEADEVPHVWLLTQDSKSPALTPSLVRDASWYTSRPRQLYGARVLTVGDPVAVCAWALQVLLDAPDRSKDERPRLPRGFATDALPLARLWAMDSKSLGG